MKNLELRSHVSLLLRSDAEVFFLLLLAFVSLALFLSLLFFLVFLGIESAADLINSI